MLTEVREEVRDHMPHRILIADDNEIFRDGLRAVVQSNENWQVCGEAADGAEAIQKARQMRPDLIIMDFSMPRICGIDAAREIHKELPKLPILLLTLFLTQQLAEEARNAGISAAVSKTKLDNLLDGIQATFQGKEYWSHALKPTSF